MKQQVNGKGRNGPVLTTKAVASFSGIEASVLMGSEDQKPFSVIRMMVSKGRGAPAHVSPDEDKVFHVTEGAFLFLVGDSRVEVAPGDCIFVGKGEVHSFCAVATDKATMTLVSTPPGHEQFFLALSALPEPHGESDVAEVCKRCRQEIVGPVVQP